ncbi:acyl-CoA thioesterase [Aeromicrobium sp.]|uniref:acyl-CoA thioesterase n=1 Tax=Aeromicrobium sp. TaxID=1871063 RepID=UPI003D6A116D
MHDIRIPMRWADLDQLNHVNNVVYVDYAMEARAQLVDESLLDDDLPIRRVRVEFMRPLLLSSKPVTVRSSVDGDVLTQEIRSHDGSALFSTVVTEHGRPEPIDDDRGTPLQMWVRRSDVGPDGAVTLTRLFELFQETRIMSFASVIPHRQAGRFVVGRVELDPGESLPWRREPYPVQSHISHVGRSSFSSTTRIDGGQYGSATATLVGFDLTNQRSRRLDDDEREALTAAMLPA